jgi:hypothetical protein
MNFYDWLDDFEIKLGQGSCQVCDLGTKVDRGKTGSFPGILSGAVQGGKIAGNFLDLNFPECPTQNGGCK